MARRRKDDAWIWAIPQAVGLFLALGMLNPAFRQALASIMSLVLWLAIFLVAGAVVLVVYWEIANRNKSDTRYLTNVWGAAPANSPITEIDRLPLRPSVVPTPTASFVPRADPPLNTTELIEQLRSIDWFQFEKIIGLTYRKLGYSVTRRGGAKPDGGIDLMIEKGGERSAVQCKQWKTWQVGVKTVREFLGALTDSKTESGILITLRGYTTEAKELADKHRIELITQMRLIEMLEATNARFDPETLEILRDARKFCPKCERQMVLRTATKGAGAGKQFWGCAGYPRCRFTMPL